MHRLGGNGTWTYGRVDVRTSEPSKRAANVNRKANWEAHAMLRCAGTYPVARRSGWPAESPKATACVPAVCARKTNQGGGG